MITINSYFPLTDQFKVSELPGDLKNGYEFVKKLTENHTTWKYYKDDEEIKEVVDAYFVNLDNFLHQKLIKQHPELNHGKEKEAREAAMDMIKVYVERGDTIEQLRQGQMGSHSDRYSAYIKGNKIFISELKLKKVDFSFPLQSVFNEIKYSHSNREKKENKVPTPVPAKPEIKKQEQKTTIMRISTENAKPIERIDEEVRFIKRYTLMHGKVKTESQILSFINSLQRAIIERRIRKTSQYAKEIQLIQSTLVKIYENMKKEVRITLDNRIIDKFMAISGSEKVRLSINYMKRFVGLQGKNITKEKARKLFDLITAAIQKGNIQPNDPYLEKVKNVLKSLKYFIEVGRKTDTIAIHQTVLNGINTALGCDCCDKKKGLSGLGDVPVEAENKIQHGRVINSMDFCEMEFETIGFMGKWKDFIGDPSPGFSAMIFGRPKFGKSHLAIDFAAYLARHHGNVLYIAKEEGLDRTLQEKLNKPEIKHPCLTVTDELQPDYSPYDFIFFDSVNTLKLSPEDIQQLKHQYPGKSFFSVHQTTKSGSARGKNTAMHNVDAVIEIPEKGKAVQYGRFNQGGEMNIFE